MTDCEVCGIAPGDFPFEDLGISIEDVEELMYEWHEGYLMCQGCADGCRSIGIGE